MKTKREVVLREEMREIKGFRAREAKRRLKRMWSKARRKDVGEGKEAERA